MTATADKEATDKRATKEATAKRAAKEAAVKVAAAEEAAGKTTGEAAGATGGSPAPGQVPSVAGAKRAAAPPRQPNVPTGCLETSVCPAFSLFFFFFFLWGFILLLPFLPRSSPSGMVTAMVTAAADATVRVTPRSAPDGEPRTPEGVPEDVVEAEGEPEVAPEPAPEVVPEEAPAEGAMIVVHMVLAPLPSRGARAPLLSVPRKATALRAATGEGMEVVLGHPIPYALGDISVGEVVSTAHQALSQAQRVLHHEG
jgi:hypothetical protein